MPALRAEAVSRRLRPRRRSSTTSRSTRRPRDGDDDHRPERRRQVHLREDPRRDPPADVGADRRQRRRHHEDARSPDPPPRPRLRAAERQRLQAPHGAGEPRGRWLCFAREHRDRAWRRSSAIFTDLDKAKEKKAGFLSGGQQNLLAIARALMVDPSVDHARRADRRSLARLHRRRLEPDRAYLAAQHRGRRRRAERRAGPQALGLTSTSSWPAGTTCTARRTKSPSLDLASIFLGRSHAD